MHPAHGYAILLVYTPKAKDVIRISITSASLPAKKRILTVCVRLFLEKGYRRTTLAEIIEKAEVSYSTFQNIFRAKDGVLTELVEFMFSNQFAMARSMTGAQLPPVYTYAVETAIQMTLTELNENLREIYIEAYTQKEASDYIFRETAKELQQIFGPYQPGRTARDFYDMEIGSASIMRGYMAHPCDAELTLEKKLRLFFCMSLRAYRVPEDELEQVIRFVEGLDIRAIAERVMHALFEALAMRFEFPCRESRKRRNTNEKTTVYDAASALPAADRADGDSGGGIHQREWWPLGVYLQWPDSYVRIKLQLCMQKQP